MEWSDIGDQLVAIAPSIAGVLANVALPGVGPLAASATRELLAALGLAPDATPDDAAKVLAGGDPATLLALKQADQKFAADMKALDIDLARIDAGDRDSARKREMSVRDHVTPTLAIATVSGFFGLAGLQAAGVVHDVDLLLLCNSLAVMVLQYYFGSSSGSRQKTEALASAIGPKSQDGSGWKIDRGPAHISR